MWWWWCYYREYDYKLLVLIIVSIISNYNNSIISNYNNDGFTNKTIFHNSNGNGDVGGVGSIDNVSIFAVVNHDKMLK